MNSNTKKTLLLHVGFFVIAWMTSLIFVYMVNKKTVKTNTQSDILHTLKISESIRQEKESRGGQFLKRYITLLNSRDIQKAYLDFMKENGNAFFRAKTRKISTEPNIWKIYINTKVIKNSSLWVESFLRYVYILNNSQNLEELLSGPGNEKSSTNQPTNIDCPSQLHSTPQSKLQCLKKKHPSFELSNKYMSMMDFYKEPNRSAPKRSKKTLAVYSFLLALCLYFCILIFKDENFFHAK